MKIRILLVDDRPFIRRALKISLGDKSSLEIVGEAEIRNRTQVAILVNSVLNY